MPPSAPEPTVRDGLAFRGKHWRLWVGNDGIVRAVLEGDHDRASIEAILEAVGDIADKVQERPLRVLYYGHRPLRLAPEARERLIEACRAHLNLRLAVVRASPLALIQVRAIARHSGREFTFHASEPEALHALGAAQPVERRSKVQAAAAPPAPDVGVVDHVA